MLIGFDFSNSISSFVKIEFNPGHLLPINRVVANNVDI